LVVPHGMAVYSSESVFSVTYIFYRSSDRFASKSANRKVRIQIYFWN
jgi:hypothetical protein